MKVTVVQTNPALLDVQANVEEVISRIRHAGEGGADLIVFPELALTGYFVGQRYHEAALTMDSREIKRLAAATRGTAAVVGFIEESPSMNFYNSALVAADGDILYAHRKLNLPNYGVFEERKFFAHGKRIRVFKLNSLTVAVFICNDLWHPSIPYLGVCRKADIFVSIFNSSQGSMGDEFKNIDSWEIIDTFYSRIFGIYNICANRVGEEVLQDDAGRFRSNLQSPDAVKEYVTETAYSFWGGSEIINPFGMRIAKAAFHEPDEISADISRNLVRKKRILLPYLRDDDPYFTHRQLGRILYAQSDDRPDNPER